MQDYTIVLTSSQDKLHRDMCFYFHHRGCDCGGMFCISHLWLDLPLGCRSRWEKVWALLWLCGCLVEYNGLDHILCQYVFREPFTFTSTAI